MMYSTVLLENKAKPAVTVAYSIVLYYGPCLGENASTGSILYSSPILVLFKHNTGFILAQYWTCSGPILVHIIRIPQESSILHANHVIGCDPYWNIGLSRQHHTLNCAAVPTVLYLYGKRIKTHRTRKVSTLGIYPRMYNAPAWISSRRRSILKARCGYGQWTRRSQTKEGFCSMEALTLVDGEDLSRTKIPRGQQKRVLKAIRPLQPSQATCADRPPTCERPAGSGQQSTEPTAGGVIDDAFNGPAGKKRK